MLVALVLVAVRRWIEYPWWVAALIVGLDVAKDAVLYPFLRRAYETGTPTVADQLVASGALRSNLSLPKATCSSGANSGRRGWKAGTSRLNLARRCWCKLSRG